MRVFERDPLLEVEFNWRAIVEEHVLYGNMVDAFMRIDEVCVGGRHLGVKRLE